MKSVPLFTGFTPQTISFLQNLKENNFRQWFEEHRQEYEIELLQPFRSLVVALSPTMHNIDSRFELRPHKAISRIYRDIRFSKNKEPYKTCLWMSFERTGVNWENFPGYFMELSHERCVYGMGLYNPKRNVMDAFRDTIEYAPDEFEELTKRTVLNRGFSVEGEAYKRLLPNDLSDYFQTWMQRKSLYVMKLQPFDDTLFSPTFADKLADDFTALRELYAMMGEAAGEVL